MDGRRKGGIAEIILAITAGLAVCKLLGILPVRWWTVFAPIRLGILAVIIALLAAWILDHKGRR